MQIFIQDIDKAWGKKEKKMKIQHSGLTLEREKEGETEKARKKYTADRSCKPSAIASSAVSRFIL